MFDYHGTHTVTCVCVCVHAKLFQSCPTLCYTMACSSPGFSVHRSFQARILEWVAVPSSRRCSQKGSHPCLIMSPAPAGGFFTASTTWEYLIVKSKHSKNSTFFSLPLGFMFWASSFICVYVN